MVTTLLESKCNSTENHQALIVTSQSQYELCRRAPGQAVIECLCSIERQATYPQLG